jgi:hypothetical protein
MSIFPPGPKWMSSPCGSGWAGLMEATSNLGRESVCATTRQLKIVSRQTTVRVRNLMAHVSMSLTIPVQNPIGGALHAQVCKRHHRL